MQTTRKFPRTLQEAFGPYANGSQLFTEYDPMPKEDKLVLVVGVIALVTVVAMILVGWVK